VAAVVELVVVVVETAFQTYFNHLSIFQEMARRNCFDKHEVKER